MGKAQRMTNKFIAMLCTCAIDSTIEPLSDLKFGIKSAGGSELRQQIFTTRGLWMDTLGLSVIILTKYILTICVHVQRIVFILRRVSSRQPLVLGRNDFPGPRWVIGSDLDRALCPPIYSSPSQPRSIVRAATGLPVLHSSPRQWNPRFVRIHSQTEKDILL